MPESGGMIFVNSMTFRIFKNLANFLRLLTFDE